MFCNIFYLLQIYPGRAWLSHWWVWRWCRSETWCHLWPAHNFKVSITSDIFIEYSLKTWIWWKTCLYHKKYKKLIILQFLLKFFTRLLHSTWFQGGLNSIYPSRYAYHADTNKQQKNLKQSFAYRCNDSPVGEGEGGVQQIRHLIVPP